jgi:hypothetical protein
LNIGRIHGVHLTLGTDVLMKSELGRRAVLHVEKVARSFQRGSRSFILLFGLDGPPCRGGVRGDGRLDGGAGLVFEVLDEILPMEIGSALRRG